MITYKKKLLTILTLISLICICLVSAFCLSPVKADEKPTTATSFKMLDGAEIRVGGGGMRYTAFISADDYSSFITAYGEDNVEFGILLARAQDTSDAETELVIDGSALTEYVEGTSYPSDAKVFQRKSVIPALDDNDKDGDGDVTEYVFHGVFTASEANNAKDFVARGYIKYTDGDTTDYVYTNAVSRSAFEVAYKFLLDGKSNDYASQVVDSVLADYPTLEVTTSVNGGTAESVKIGDKVTLSAKLWDSAKENYLEVSPKYVINTYSELNEDGSYTVKTLDGFSYAAEFPTLNDVEETLAITAGEVYTATYADNDFIFSAIEGYGTALNGDIDTPVISNDVTSAPAAGAEISVKFNADRNTSDKITSNHSKGLLGFNSNAYSAGDYLTFDFYYTKAGSCALWFTDRSPSGGYSNAVGGAQFRNITLYGASYSRGDNAGYSIRAFEPDTQKQIRVGDGSHNNSWITIEVKFNSDITEFRIYNASISNAGELDTYYFKNIRLSKTSIVGVEQPENVVLSMVNNSGYTTAGTLEKITDSTTGFDSSITGMTGLNDNRVPIGAEYKVGLFDKVNLYINANVQKATDTKEYVLSFKFFNASSGRQRLQNPALSYTVYSSVYPIKDSAYNTNGITHNYNTTHELTDKYKVQIFTEAGDLVDFNSTTEKYECQWLTVIVTFANVDTFKLSASWTNYPNADLKNDPSNTYRYFYFKDFNVYTQTPATEA